MQFADALAPPDFAEPAAAVQRQARFILRQYARLQRPDAVALGFFDQPIEQGESNAAAARRLSDVDADLGDACLYGPAGDGTQRRPADDPVITSRDQSGKAVMRPVPLFPLRRRGLEGGVACG